MAEIEQEIIITLKLSKREAQYIKTCVQNAFNADEEPEEFKSIRESIWKAIHSCNIDVL